MKTKDLKFKKGSIIITETSRRKGGYFKYEDIKKEGFFAVFENKDYYEIVPKDCPFGYFLKNNTEFKIAFLFGNRKKLVKLYLKPTTLKTILKNIN
jgi:hypothetical protein